MRYMSFIYLFTINISVVRGIGVPNYSMIERNHSMIIYYLYIKTHKTTGLCYLGQTKQNPFEYLGSGKYWRRHLQKHGSEIETVILQKCYSKTSLRSWGTFYSKLWNIVKSNKWANLKPEEGDGWGSGIYNPMHNAATRAKHQAAINNPNVKEKHRQAMVKLHADPCYKKQREGK
jgi:hypothetical protein